MFGVDAGSVAGQNSELVVPMRVVPIGKSGCRLLDAFFGSLSRFLAKSYRIPVRFIPASRLTHLFSSSFMFLHHFRTLNLLLLKTSATMQCLKHQPGFLC
jgi:hypothetical protein